MSFLLFDDAKVRPFSDSRKSLEAFSVEKHLILDLNQAIVCENNRIFSFLYYFLTTGWLNPREKAERSCWFGLHNQKNIATFAPKNLNK